jgi:metal-dependent amidase/aminoacylase/carboxypeptidase family protein
VVAASALVMLSQSVVSRATNPLDAVVLGFSHIDAGRTWNIIPDTAFLEGTIRALAEEKARSAAEQLTDICRAIEVAYGVSVNLDWWMDAPPTNNDATLTEAVGNVARSRGMATTRYNPTMMGEDFGYYQQKIPGVFFNYGVGPSSGLHTPTFTAHTDHLADAARLFADIVVSRLS